MDSISSAISEADNGCEDGGIRNFDTNSNVELFVADSEILSPGTESLISLTIVIL